MTVTGFRQLAVLFLALVPMAAGSCQSRVSPPRINLVIILVDTLRADHLGCYGYERPTSPNIDRLASGGTLFENAVSQSSWTLPSAASLLTGLYPMRHQAVWRKAQLPLARITLAEVLSAEGYATGAVVSHSLVSSDHDLDQGFDFFDETHISGHAGISSPGVTDVAVRWLRENRGQPFFLFLHYFDPHYAYLEHEGYEFGQRYEGWVDPKAPFRTIQTQRGRLDQGDIEFLRDRYDGEIAFTDHHIGIVLGELDRLGLTERTVVVLVGDHGEEFLDHGWLGHTTHLYEEIVRVPLIVHHPGMNGLPDRVAEPVELIDVLPTVLAMSGVDSVPAGIDGRNLLAMLEGRAPADTTAFSEVCLRSLHANASDASGRTSLDLKCLRCGRWKLIHDAARQSWELYDLPVDPAEEEDLASTAPRSLMDGLRNQLVERAAALERLARVENAVCDSIVGVDPEREERLRALGYVQ